jgi:hypothetical protein
VLAVTLPALREIVVASPGLGSFDLRARVLHERWLSRHGCPSFEVGSHAGRPGVEELSPGVLLAGDFVRLPFPAALMERAASAGVLAANTLLARWGGGERAALVGAAARAACLLGLVGAASAGCPRAPCRRRPCRLWRSRRSRR